MDRNIITPADVAPSSAETQEAMRPDESIEPDDNNGGFDALEKGARRAKQPVRKAGPGSAEASSKAKKPDEWQDRLLKFIPLEAVGLYLGIDAALRSADLASTTEKRIWFGVALGVTLLFTWLYLRLKGKVSRRSQIAASLLAVSVWVFAIGGVFATFAFYRPWQGTVLLVVTAAFLSIVPLKPLPRS